MYDSVRLDIEAPNQVSVVGNYTFYLNIWKVTLTVEPPCDSTYLKGNVDLGNVNVELDKELVLRVQFTEDDQSQSWE